MHVLIFEDDAVDRLGLITACRPACDVTLGATTLHDALTAFGAVRRILRPRLARYVAALGGRRIPLWGGAPDPIPQPSVTARGGLALLVNARAVPSRDTLVALRSLVEAGRRAVVRRDDTVVAALLHFPADGGTPDDRAVERIVTGDWSAVRALEELGLPAVDSSIRTLDAPHEVVEVHEATLEGSLAVKIDSGRFRETRRGLFVADGAEVADEVAVRSGPVVVAAGATVAPFACLDGPIWIGPRARVNPHTWLREGTSLGLECRAGGEIESTVLEPFSNKPHEGFLGHSHVGSWANLAAGTVTSNLKATYGPIRLHETRSDGGRTTVHTGRQFLGALVGDLVKTAINSSIPCGARLGVAAMVRGAVADVVPAFTNDILGGRSTAEQAATVLGRMMARRGLELLDADRALLDDLASAG